MKIKRLEQKELTGLVALHYQVLPGEVLTSISRSFLLGFYQLLHSSKKSHVLGAFDNNKLVGGIVGLEKEYQLALKDYLRLLGLMLVNFPKLLLKPNRLFNLVESFLFKLKSRQRTEIFFIGVIKSWQKKGVGARLIKALEKMLVNKYKYLSVDCKCKLSANRFYQELGFIKIDQFVLYGEKWNRYEKKIE